MFPLPFILALLSITPYDAIGHCCYPEKVDAIIRNVGRTMPEIYRYVSEQSDKRHRSIRIPLDKDTNTEYVLIDYDNQMNYAQYKDGRCEKSRIEGFPQACVPPDATIGQSVTWLGEEASNATVYRSFPDSDYDKLVDVIGVKKLNDGSGRCLPVFAFLEDNGEVVDGFTLLYSNVTTNVDEEALDRDVSSCVLVDGFPGR